MKLRLSFSIHFNKPSDIVRVVRIFGSLLLVGYGLWIVWLLYQTVFLNIVAPKAIDPSQVTAKQEKVNTKLLDTVTARDAARRKPPDFTGLNDPFSP